MPIATKLKEALALAGEHDGHPRWWLSPDGELRPCAEHEFAARAILRELKLVPTTGRAVFDQMFALGWVRVVGEKSRISYETSRFILREANEDQLRSLKALASECCVELYNATTNQQIPT